MRRPDEPSERLRRILAGVDHPDDTAARAQGDDRDDDESRAGPDGHDDPPPRALTLPPSIASARWRVRPRAVVGVAVLLAVAVTVLGVRLHLAQQQARPQDVPATDRSTAQVTTTGDRSAFEPPAAAAASTSAGPASGGEVYVHVVGRVRSPGVVTVPAGARVEQAIEGAGGARSGADLSQVNLARPVVDGEQVVVPREGATAAPAATAATGAAGAPPAPGGASGASAPGGGGVVAPVDLNAADQATLESLPGVGPVLAARIIEWRTTNGRFTTVEELDEVSGIGEKLYAQISPKVTV